MLATIATFSGCAKDAQPPNTSDNSAENTVVEAPSVSTGMKRVGELGKGFVNVPDIWSKFVDVEANNDFQISDGGGTIITLNTIGAVQSEVGLGRIKDNIMQNVGVTSEEIVPASIRGYNGHKVEFNFDDGMQLIVWLVAVDENEVRFIAVEGIKANIPDAIKYVEDSYDIV